MGGIIAKQSKFAGHTFEQSRFFHLYIKMHELQYLAVIHIYANRIHCSSIVKSKM